MPIITDIQPFTYRSGMTYLEILMRMQKWLNETFVPEVNNAIQTAQTNYQAGIDNAQNAVTDLSASWTTQFNTWEADVTAQIAALSDHAAAGLANDPASELGTALRQLFESLADATTLHDAIDAINTTVATLASAADLAATNANVAANTTAIAARVLVWQANTHYAAGTELVTPDGDTVKALQDHTTGTVFDPTLYTGNFGFLVAFHNDGAQERLNLYYSPTGRTVLGGYGNPVYTPASTGHSLRDPSIRKIGDTWYCAYTANNGFSLNFEIAQSTDLVNWTLTATIDCSTLPTIRNAWAPEFVQDTDGSWIIVFTVVHTDTGNPHDFYWVRAQNPQLTSWTAPALVRWTGLGQGAIPIDATVVRYNGEWYAFYGNNGVIQRATFTNWGDVWNTDKNGDWAGFIAGAPQGANHMGYEGPEIVDMGSGHFRLYLDEYTNPSAFDTGVVYSDSFDGMATWTTPKVVAKGPGFPPDSNIRHGSWYKIHSATELVQAQSVAFGTGQRLRHAEFYSSNGTVAGQVYGAAGQVLTNDPGRSSADWQDWLSLSGTSLTFLREGEYTLDIIAPNTEQGMTVMGAGSWIAMKGPLPGTTYSKIYASTDLAATAAAQSLSRGSVWLKAGDVITFEVQTANAMPSNWAFLVSVSKKV
jgi:hypothetical protein